MSIPEQLISAIENKENKKVFKLLEKLDVSEVNKKVNGKTALYVSCEKFNDEALDKLLSETGIDVNISYKGRSCESSCCSQKETCGRAHEMTPLHVASNNNNIYAVSRLLVAPKVNVNAKTASAWSPLHLACYNNHHQVVEYLLASPDIQVNLADRRGTTPIMCSAELRHGESLKKMLADPRVDVDAKDMDGNGLEELVGYWVRGGEDKEKCLQMINSEKRKRKNGQIEQETSQDGSIGRHIKIVDRLNKEIRDEEEKLKRNMEVSYKQKREDLKKQHISEKEKLAKELAAKHKKEETDLETTIMTETKANERCIRLFKEQRDELVHDLQKIKIDPAQDASEDRDKLEAALNKQEAAKRALECPVCFQFMRPPTRIWMCEFSHLICEACKDALEASDLLDGGKCPTCTSRPISQRAFTAEQFAKISFGAMF